MQFFSTKSNYSSRNFFRCFYPNSFFCSCSAARENFSLALKAKKRRKDQFHSILTFASFRVRNSFDPVSHQKTLTSHQIIFSIIVIIIISCCAPEFRVLSVSGFCRPASWRTEGRSLGASGCRSAAGPRRRCAETGRSCCGWWSHEPWSPGSPEIEALA